MSYNKIKTRRWYKIYKNVMNKHYLIQKFGMGWEGQALSAAVGGDYLPLHDAFLM